LLLSLAVQWGEESKAGLMRALSVVTNAPAQVLGASLGTLQASIGQLVNGGIADVCVFDPKPEWVVTANSLRSQGTHTPFAGYPMRGRVRCTIAAGQVAHENAE
jgi:dihydroorotase